MRVATWNVNSVRTRVSRVTDFLRRHRVDVLAMQEIKCRPDQFPTRPFEDMGYQVFVNGVNHYNGVAVVSRLPAHLLGSQFSGMVRQPMFGDPPYLEPRALGVRVAGVEIWSLYVPNGRELDHPHYKYKLEWLEAFRSHACVTLQADANALGLYLGDFNVAPCDSDVWDIADFVGDTHVSVAERAAFARLLNPAVLPEALTLPPNFNVFEDDEWFIQSLAASNELVSSRLCPANLEEVSRRFAPGWTYWDYQHARWRRDQGMKIDFILATPALVKNVSGGFIEREERGRQSPSDHVPVVLDIS